MYLCGRQSAHPQSTVMACCGSQSMTCQVDGVETPMLLACEHAGAAHPGILPSS
jgi:hypothetical protein